VVQLRVLGTLEVAGEPDDEPVQLRSARSRRLLAALLVRHGEVAPVDWLAEVVWGADQPRNAEGALQNLVSRLRTTLRAADGAGDALLLTRPPGYLIAVGEATSDAVAFEAAAARGRALLATSPGEAVAVLDAALALWRGAAYAEFADSDFARPEAGRLEELRASAVEDLVDGLLATGRHDDALARLEVHVAGHELRERPHAQLVLARYRAGRQAEALEAYRTYRARLDDQLGLEPSGSLRDLESAVLRRDPALDAPPAPVPSAPVGHDTADGVPRPRDGDRTTGPTGPTDWGTTAARDAGVIGRDDDLARLAVLVAPGSIVTLTGPGGVGKTTLASTLAAAVGASAAPAGPVATYPDGVHLLELGALADGAAVPHAVATAIGAQLRPDVSPLDGLVDNLRARRALLVLDNCEHVVAAAADLVHALHAGCPGLALLATSRTPLDVAGEQVWPVPPLPVPPPLVDDPASAGAHAAVQLFVARAQARAPRFRLDEASSAPVSEICRRLDGLPLAIELAAVRMASMSPQDLADRLSWRFRLLHGGPRSAAERHRTLRAVVDWSYDLLDEEQQQAFEVLSVFTGPITLAAAESLVAAVPLPRGRMDAGTVAEVVSDLVDRSMVVARHGRDGTRYALLETLRVYGAERLGGRPWAGDVRRIFAEQRTDVAASCEAELYGAQHIEAMHRLIDEFDDLRAAHSWALQHDLRVAASLVGHLALFAEQRMVSEVARWADQTLAAAESSPEPVDVTRVLAVSAGGARFRGEFELAGRLVEQALALDPPPSTEALLHAVGSEVALLSGALDNAREHSRQVEARAGPDGPFAAMARVMQSLLLTYEGTAAAGAAVARRVRQLADANGWRPVAAWATYAEGEALQDTEPEHSLALHEDAVRQARGTGDSYLVGVALVSAASVAASTGDPRAAAGRFDEVVAHWHEAGNWAHQWTTLRNVADLLARSGAPEDAAVLLGAVSTPHRSASLYGADAERLTVLGATLAEALGDTADSLREHGAGLGDEEVVAWARAALARQAMTSQP
jgi:predicted ATPase/DNA-binding SARP family transcriptional activator